MRDYKELYNYWLNSDSFDEETRAELKSIENNEEEIRERFYMDLEFGTAGLRGIMGAGTNRMNKYVIRRSTQGLANYINKQTDIKNKAVAIAFDSRNNSKEFADEAALVLCANNIKVYIFDVLKPTPMLSFAIRHFNCTAGINITASHNPPKYNGYKVYFSDGAQITPPHDSGIMNEVMAITDFSTLAAMDKQEAIDKKLYNVIDSSLDTAYLSELKRQIKHMDTIKKHASDISIVYSPLHGTGMEPVRSLLGELGFTNFHVVKEQEKPDGNFPTVSYPNPEADEAFVLGLKLADCVNADIVLATDPDADRLGVRVRDKEGHFHTLTGNMSGCLLAEYEIASMKEMGLLNEKSTLVKSIVSSNMAGAIAKAYNIRLVDVLTGFKYIGQQMTEYEINQSYEYAFGFEESYGCLIGTYARDKDAIVATMALVEAVCYYKEQGKTLWDVMIELYEKYGYYLEDVVSLNMEGEAGMQQIKSIMQSLRATELKNIGDFKVLNMKDYQSDVMIDYENGTKGSTKLPKSNVIYYTLENDSWICVRPSGTEPKLKLYIGARGKDKSVADDNMSMLKREITDIVHKNEK